LALGLRSLGNKPAHPFATPAELTTTPSHALICYYYITLQLPPCDEEITSEPNQRTSEIVNLEEEESIELVIHPSQGGAEVESEEVRDARRDRIQTAEIERRVQAALRKYKIAILLTAAALFTILALAIFRRFYGQFLPVGLFPRWLEFYHW
jgi:hypothetical protein